VLEAKNPWRLRSGAAAMDAAGDSIDQEIYRMDNLVAGAVSGGADAWMGDGASACVQAFQKQVAAFRRTTNALREASSVLKWWQIGRKKSTHCETRLARYGKRQIGFRQVSPPWTRKAD
jgi:hypothetical protein